MKTILASGVAFFVDDEDYERVNAYRWYFTPEGYAINQHGETMQSLVMQAKGVDHRDRDKRNNQKENLRICTSSQNQANRPAQSNNTSGYKGVSYHRQNGKYVAHIRKDGKLKYLGSFSFSVEAAIAYNKAAIENFGEFAFLNPIPPDWQQSKATVKGTI